jgi:carbon-monoxide dehydrogenase medium subunit
MKPSSFAYVDPDDVETVLDVLAEHGDDATVIAGGQSLVPLLNLRLAQPRVVVDVRRCSALRELSIDEVGLRAGALVTAGELERDARARALPGLSEALVNVAHVQIRNRTTIGGSIAHADPAAELPALLLALGGDVELRSAARGSRRVSAAEFLVGPCLTARLPDELLTEVRLPRHPGRVVVREVGPRPGDFALVGVVVAGRVDAGLLADVRVVVFGAGGRAQRLTSVEMLLDGRVADEAAVEAGIADAVRVEAEAVDDVHAPAAYRRHVAGTLAVRALRDVLVADQGIAA